MKTFCWHFIVVNFRSNHWSARHLEERLTPWSIFMRHYVQDSRPIRIFDGRFKIPSEKKKLLKPHWAEGSRCCKKWYALFLMSLKVDDQNCSSSISDSKSTRFNHIWGGGEEEAKLFAYEFTVIGTNFTVNFVKKKQWIAARATENWHGEMCSIFGAHLEVARMRWLDCCLIVSTFPECQQIEG